MRYRGIIVVCLKREEVKEMGLKLKVNGKFTVRGLCRLCNETSLGGFG